ncbi:hypothetical protein BOX15_Mlig031603g1, partial [Macrostomum lignano]
AHTASPSAVMAAATSASVLGESPPVTPPPPPLLPQAPPLALTVPDEFRRGFGVFQQRHLLGKAASAPSSAADRGGARIGPRRARFRARLGQELIEAVNRRHSTARVRRLLEAGAPPNVADKKGRTPLHIASARGDSELVDCLLACGADPSRVDCVGNTPARLAAVTGRLDLVGRYLAAGATQADLGRSPVALARDGLARAKRAFTLSGDTASLLQAYRDARSLLRTCLTIQERQSPPTPPRRVASASAPETPTAAPAASSTEPADAEAEEVDSLLLRLEGVRF